AAAATAAPATADAVPPGEEQERPAGAPKPSPPVSSPTFEL
ncbi:MAG: hypothetical protein JWN08_1293, partial [Frankiales bacterium]|nr:hypothetical protein [Frankiales bacterium]